MTPPAGRPPEIDRPRLVVARLPAAAVEAIDAAAKRKGVSRAAVLRHIVAFWMARTGTT